MTTRLRVLVAVPAALIAVHLLSPAAFAAGGSVVNLYHATIVACLVLAATGLRALRIRTPLHRWPWYAVGATIPIWFIGDVLYSLRGDEPVVSGADVFYLAGYGTLIAGIWAITRQQSAGPAIDRALDLSITALGMSYAVWQLVIQPILEDTTGSAIEQMIVSSYPVADAVLLIVVLHLAISTGRRTITNVGLAVTAIALIGADLAYAVSAATGVYADHARVLDSLWLVSYLGIAVAVATSDSHRALPPSGRPPLLTARITLAAGAVLMTPSVLLLNLAIDREVHIRGTIINFGAMIALSTWRFLRLADAADTAREELERREQYFRMLALNSSDVSLVLDDRLHVRDVSRTLNGVHGTNLEGRFRADPLLLFEPEDRQSILALVDDARSEPGHAVVGQGRLRTDGTDHRWVELRITHLADDTPIGGIVVNISDITQRKRIEAQLEHQVLHDPLTGLANRWLFRDRIAHTLERQARHGGTVTVVFCDLDGFSEVNEATSQPAGDQLLREVGARLDGAVRADDTVARLGADEFALLLDSVGDIGASAEEAIARARAALVEPFDVDGTLISLTASFGAAVAEEGISSADELLRNTDLALCQAKHEGGDRTVHYTPSMGEAASNRRQIEADLRLALDADEFVLHYQPLVDLPAGHLRGFEALVRWNHPRRGLLMPGEFIAIAEQTGQIVDIGGWVLQEACASAAEWGRRFPDRADLEVAVNVSGRQLADPRLTRRVLTALNQSGLDPHRLVLELTESVLVDQPEEANAHLSVLRGMGVRLAIDDFGTGYSSIGYLQQFSVDIVKIDRGFVQGIVDEGLPPLVRAMLELSRTLGAACIAEGIEEPHQASALAGAGCPLGQGYWFSRPVDHAAALAIVGSRLPLGSTPGCGDDQLPLPLQG